MADIVVNITKNTDTPVAITQAASIDLSMSGNTFEDDSDGDLMPKLTPVASTQYDIDGDTDIMPSLA